MNQNIPIVYLTDCDFYKLTMGQCILHNFPKSKARFDFKCRNEDVKLGYLKPRIDQELDLLCNLRFTADELNYLSNIPWISEDYIDYLERFYLKRDEIHTEVGNDGQLVMWAEGPWRDITFFEIPCLSIVSELYMADQAEKTGIDWMKIGQQNLDDTISKLKKCYADGYKFTLADFGARRRFSRQWHEHVVEEFKAKAPELFVGTSDVYFAMKHKVKPIGTFAHEFLEGLQRQNIRLSEAQKAALETWTKEYRGELGIALSDNYGFRAFLRDFDKYFAKLFDGCRHDSGNPFTWGHMLIDHYKKLNIDPTTKIGCWSDSLNADKCVEIAKEFYGKIKVSFGVGTHLTNNCGIKPLNMVMKMTECNDGPVAKISDAPGKGMCRDEEYVKYLKSVYDYRSIDE